MGAPPHSFDVRSVIAGRTRLPGADTAGFLELAPDLAVEVLSPGDRPGEVRQKVLDWLEAGVGLIWVVDPESMTARVYRPDGSVMEVDSGGVLSGEDVLPGLVCPLSEQR